MNNQQTKIIQLAPDSKHYAKIGAVFLIALAGYFLLQRFDLVPSGLGISENMSYGIVFVLGLLAAFSTCMAVTGGLLLAISGRHAEESRDSSSWERFRPHVFFNLGRVVSYTIFGGAIGALGSALTLSARASGILTVAVSVFMILLGVRMLRILPWFNRFTPQLPRFLTDRAYDFGSKSGQAPFFAGAVTFFLPCGFTQALQLYVLGAGGVATGAITMFVFALGTLPALLSLGAVSSFARGALRENLMIGAGVVVVMLGVLNIRSGVNLVKVGGGLAEVLDTVPTTGIVQALDSNIEIINGKQVAKMKVIGLSYEPANFKVKSGVPVVWEIDGKSAQGCGRAITIPALGITEYLSKDKIKKITFTPKRAGKIYFSCTMGMTTPGAAFEVVN